MKDVNNMFKKILSILLISTVLISFSSCNKNSYDFSFFRGAFSPFFALQPEDISVVDATQETLLVTQGEAAEFVKNAYTKGVGIADIETEYDADENLVCTVKLGKDVYFSDGVQMTADDIIFSMYVYADPSYEGWSAFCHSDIKGMHNYHYNLPYADTTEFSEKQIQDALNNPSDELKTLLAQKVVIPVLEEELGWLIRSFEDKGYKGTELEEYMKQYPDVKDLFAFLYSIDNNYDSSKAENAMQVLDDIKAQYGYDYKTLSKVLGVELINSAYLCAKEVLLKELDTEPHANIEKIEGIEKVDDFTVKVTLTSDDAETFKKVFGIYITPLHYYGDKELYNYEENKFGFTRGDLTSVKQKDSKPLGAGQYVFNKYNVEKGVSFNVNENYFRTVENPELLYFKETCDSSVSLSHSYYVTSDDVTYVEK